MAEIVVRRQGVAGRISLNRPHALNALNVEMCVAIDATLTAWADDPEIELVVVDHCKEARGFCAGGDIRMLAQSGAADGRAARAFFRAEYQLNTRIKNYPKPYIAFIDGVTMGGGVGISVHGSHRVATERTVFAMPETGIGLFPDVGGGWFLPRLGPALGMWLALTGERLKGADVRAVGVATHFCEAAEIDTLKASICAGDLDQLKSVSLEQKASFEGNLPAINRCFWKNSVEEIFDALSAERSEWAQTQLAILKTKSPRALKVTHRQLSLGLQSPSFADNMRTEFRIACRQVQSQDFLEGVRAVIVDKDNSPKWNPATLADVSDEMIDEVFAPLKNVEELQLIA